MGLALRRLLRLDGMASPFRKLPIMLLFREAMRVWERPVVFIVLHKDSRKGLICKTDLVAKPYTRFNGSPDSSLRRDHNFDPEFFMACDDPHGCAGGPQFSRHRPYTGATGMQILQAA